MFCQKCGTKLEEESNFCQKCGNSISQPYVSNSSSKENTIKYQEPGRGTLILVLGILSIVLLGPFVGIPAWVMGNKDLKKIRNGIISFNEKSATKIGMILGILGIIGSSILIIIVLGIAIVVSINLNSANSISSNRDAVISDLNNLAALAHEYYAKPSSMAGGGNSFAGFYIPSGLESNGNGTYSVTTAGTATTIVFQGVGAQVVSGSNKVTVNYKVFVPPLVDSAQVVY